MKDRVTPDFNACDTGFAVPTGIDRVGNIHPADAPVGYYLGA